MAAGEEGVPEGVDVGGGGVDAAVAVAAHGEVQDVGAQPVVVEVADGGAAGEGVGAQERCVGEGGGLADALVDEVVEGDPGGPFGEQCEHHVTAVAVGEAVVGFVFHRVAVEHGEELLGGGQGVDGHGQDVVVAVVDLVFVEVVTDPGAVGQEVLDGDAVVDQWQVGAEQ